jgi:hypothetical protein
MTDEPGFRVLLQVSCLRLFRFIAVFLLLALPTGGAIANICRSIEAELAAVGRNGSDRGAAARHASEAARIHGHMRSIGCERSGIFALGAPPPAECGGLRARMQQHQYASSQANGGEARRRELLGMLASHNCRANPRPAAAPLVAGLFEDRSRRPTSLEIRPDVPIDPRPPIESRIRSVSGKTICVRTCDGYYFPVQIRPGTRRDEGDEVCQSLCPAAQTRLYSLRGDDVANAVSTEGEPYEDLDNAFVYRQRFDPACFCRRPGESTGPGPQVLNPDDPSGQGIVPLNGDEPAEQPPLRGFPERQQPQGGRKPESSVFGKRPPPAPPAPPHPPNEAPAERTVAADQGEVREFQARDGTKRTVRIIAPELARGPSAAEAPSARDHVPAP